MITALRTSLKSVTLNTDFAGTTATKSATTQATLPTLSGDKLRTMLNASRVPSDPVLVGSASTTTQKAASPASIPLILEALEKAWELAEQTGGAINWQRAAEKWKEGQKQ
jgi:hypothetical protein